MPFFNNAKIRIIREILFRVAVIIAEMFCYRIAPVYFAFFLFFALNARLWGQFAPENALPVETSVTIEQSAIVKDTPKNNAKNTPIIDLPQGALLGISPPLPSAVWAAESRTPTWTEYFESISPSWRLLHAEHRGVLTKQGRDKNQFHQGTGAEILQFSLPPDSCVILGHSLEFPLLIEDLAISLTVKANRPGVVIGAQIVLPNSVHPDTGKPVTYVVPGARYSGSGEWEKLGFWDKGGASNLHRQADRIAGLLRHELKLNLDLRDKYVRQLILYVEPDTEGTGSKTIWTDSLEIAGHVPIRDEQLDRFERNPVKEYAFRFDPCNYLGFKIESSMKPIYVSPLRSESSSGYTEWIPKWDNGKSAPLVATPGKIGDASDNFLAVQRLEANRQRSVYADEYEIRYQLTSQQSPGAAPASQTQIRLSDKILYINDWPRGIRAVEYRGEPLGRLRQLGFNSVWIDGPATAELLHEANQVGVWLICHPPSNSQLRAATTYRGSPSPGQDVSSFVSTPIIDPVYDSVLAWNLGDECTNANHTADSQRVSLLQAADRVRRRPILCTARSGLWEYSRIVDILMLERTPLLSSLDLKDQLAWQKTYPSLARPDTPFWCTIQTQPSAKLAEQWTMFEGNPQYICAISHEQIKMQVYQGLAAGVHGFLFNSNTPLTNDDPETEFRRYSLELINWELQMIEEWFAKGRVMPILADSSHPLMKSAVIQSGRSRLLVPIWQETQNQFEVGAAFVGKIKYTISGIPETYSAYHLVPGRLFPIPVKRVAGGMQIELDEANLNSLIFFGEEDAIYANIGKDAKTIGPRAAYLACKIAELHLASSEQVFSELKRAKELNAIPNLPQDNLPLISLKEQETMLKTTKETINLAKEMLQRHPPDYARAYLNAEQATRELRLEARNLLREATRFHLNPCMLPVSVSFATLPYYLTAYHRLGGAVPGENRLPCGDLENIYQMTQAGWDTMFHKVEGVAPLQCDTVAAAKRSGQKGLRLAVSPMGPEDKPSQLETTPLWVATPLVDVRMGEMICVNGWVRIPKKIESTVDGLMIFDSLGGESLALRFLETKGVWREFAFYRIASSDGKYCVFFGLNGFGEAHIDDVKIFPIRFNVQTPAVPAEPQPPPSTTTPWQRLNPFYYLPGRNQTQ